MVEHLADEDYIVKVDGEAVVICGPPQRFATDVAALAAGIALMREKDGTGF